MVGYAGQVDTPPIEETMSATLTINGQTTPAPTGASLFDCAETAGIQVPTSCHKQGKCKECIVEITAGMDCLTPRTEPEQHLTGNFRLSCQSRVGETEGEIRCHTMRRGSMRVERRSVELQHSVAPDPAVTRDGGRILIDGEEVERSEGPIHGIAMDLGTTTIVLRLLNLESGEQIADASFENPQRLGGSDIMARIQYDTEHPGKLLMRTLAGYLSRAIEEFPVDPRSIYEMVVVGNSTMRDLFFGRSVYSIGQSPYRSITEIEMADGKRTTTSLTIPDGDACCRSIRKRACGAPGDQRPRGRGCGGVHAGGGPGP